MHEEKEFWSGSTPEVKKGFVSYEVLILEESGRASPFTGENAIKEVIRVLHGPEDPFEELHRFRVTLGYYYINRGRAIHLKRDIYHLNIHAVKNGTLVSLRLNKGLLRTGYDELISKIVEKARETNLESNIAYASYPDEISSCR